MVNKWIEHIRKYAKDNNLSYGCALSDPKCKSSYIKTTPTPVKSKVKPSPKITDKPYTMYKEPIGPSPKTREELLIMAKNVVGWSLGSDQYNSSYDKSWAKKSNADLLKIINNFKKKNPDVKIKLTPAKMSTLQLLG